MKIAQHMVGYYRPFPWSRIGSSRTGHEPWDTWYYLQYRSSPWR